MEQNKPKPWRELYKIYPAAEKFPLLPADELKALSDDIKANGLKEPIAWAKDVDGVTWVIDGRNRLDAIWLIPENERPAIEWQGIEGESFEKYILSKNLYRRNLNLTKQQQVEKIAEVLGIELATVTFAAAENNERLSANRSLSPEPSTERLSANRSVKNEAGEFQGTVKNLAKATLVEEAAKAGISEATVKTTIAKVRGSYKPKPGIKRAVFVPPKPEPQPEKSMLEQIKERLALEQQQQQPAPAEPEIITPVTSKSLAQRTEVRETERVQCEACGGKGWVDKT
jgi:ParB-like chromosome segregation protein Spo0J